MKPIALLLVGLLIGGLSGFEFGHAIVSGEERARQSALLEEQRFAACVAAIPKRPRPRAQTRPELRAALTIGFRLLEDESLCTQRSGMPGLTLAESNARPGTASEITCPARAVDLFA